jgi:nitroreductase
MPELTPDQLLTTTRSVRRRLDLGRPVPLELVRECLEIALQAPSGSNAQTWHFVVVDDPEQKAAVARWYAKSYTAYAKGQEAAMARLAGDPDRLATQRRVAASADYLAEHMHEVPVLVIPCIFPGRDGLSEGNQAGVWGSVLPAAWSYMLAARARGLGTSWTSLHLTYEREVAEVLGLPRGVRQGALIPTAYYTGDSFKPAPRVPLEQVMHHNRWKG